MEERSKRNVQVNLDKDLVEQAEIIFNKIGLNQTVTLTAFYKQVVAEGGMPFELKQTPRQRVNQALRSTVKDMPVTHLDSADKVEAWFKDESKDY